MSAPLSKEARELVEAAVSFASTKMLIDDRGGGISVEYDADRDDARERLFKAARAFARTPARTVKPALPTDANWHCDLCDVTLARLSRKMHLRSTPHLLREQLAEQRALDGKADGPMEEAFAAAALSGVKAVR